MTAATQRFVLAAILLFGYYAIILTIAWQRSPIMNPDIVKDGMIVLGPPIGAVFGALFRTDATDERRADNTGKALDAITATAAASGTPSPVPAAVIAPGETATIAAAPIEGN